MEMQIDATEMNTHAASQIDNKLVNNNKVKRHVRLDSLRIDDLRNAISATPPPPKKMTVKEALDELASELKLAVDMGHTNASLSAVLMTMGLEVSERTIARALRAANPKRPGVKNMKIGRV